MSRFTAPRPCTPEEQALAEQWVRLPLWALNRWGKLYPELDADDLIAEANLALVRCAQRFDPALGMKFSTYAATAIWRAWQSLRRSGRRQTARGMFVPFAAAEDGEVINAPHSREPDPCRVASGRERVARIRRQLHPEYFDILALSAEGYTFLEIGKQQGMTKQAVSCRYQVALERARKEYVA